jgi:hypothetical protein
MSKLTARAQYQELIQDIRIFKTNLRLTRAAAQALKADAQAEQVAVDAAVKEIRGFISKGLVTDQEVFDILAEGTQLTLEEIEAFDQGKELAKDAA